MQRKWMPRWMSIAVVDDFAVQYRDYGDGIDVDSKRP
jgi:hypothetical protein